VVFKAYLSMVDMLGLSSASAAAGGVFRFLHLSKGVAQPDLVARVYGSYTRYCCQVSTRSWFPIASSQHVHTVSCRAGKVELSASVSIFWGEAPEAICITRQIVC
jgi:hypothetical protein